MEANFHQNQANNNFQMPISVNDFDILETLGKGAHSVVSKVRYKKTGNIYAIKTLDQKIFQNNEKRIDFLREKEILYELTQKNHPHIVKLYADFQDDNYIYLVFEYIEGISLDRLKGSEQNKGYLDQNLVINIITQLLETLKYLHETCYIMHRNIQPDNIILEKDNNIKLIGFGLSTYLVNENKVLVSNKSFKGAVKYVAPEILFHQESRDYDYKIDIFALGFTIYSLMNPSSIGKPNLPLITENKPGQGIVRHENTLINPFYNDWLKDFVKMLYEDKKEKRLSAAQALEVLKILLKK